MVLALLLVVLAACTRPDRSFSSDEGAAVLQAKRLAAGAGWLRPNEFPEIDPTGAAFFYTLSDGGPQQFLTYGKHPTYPIMLAVLDRLGGTFAMELFSVAGTVGAALAAARLGRRLDPAIERPSFWILALGSPMLFYSQVVLAHSVGAALAGTATVLVLRARASFRVLPAVGALGLVAAATLLRTETVLFSVVVSLVLGIPAFRNRQWRLVVLAIALPLASVAANLADRTWYGHIFGAAPAAILNTAATPDFLETRLSGAADILLLPGATWPTAVSFGLLMMVVAVVGGALFVRRTGKGGMGLRIGCVVAVVGSVLPFAVAAPDTIPSILITFPILLAGLALLHSDDLVGESGFLFWTTILFVVAVAATQYTQGGGAEWGARFLMLVLPLITPVAVNALSGTARLIPGGDRRWAGVTLGILAVAMSLLSVRVMLYYKGNIDTWVDVMSRATVGREGPDLGDGDRRPIVLTTWGGLGRFIWPIEPQPRGLTVPGDRLRSYGEALREEGATEIVLATYDPDHDLAALDGIYEVVEAMPPTAAKPPVYLLRAR